jgi:hypothetical protein
MIITAHIGATFGGVLKYVHKANVNLPEEQKPIILEENHVHGTHQDQARLMNYVSKINSRSIYPVLHLTVSYPEKDNPTQKEVDKHLKEVIKGFGATAENNQYVIVAHRDSAKDIANRTAHYHIVINKVGFNGQNINTDWYKNNAQVVADKIEQQYELTRTIGRDVLYDSDPKNEKGYKYATKKEKITALVTRKKAGKDYVISDKRKKVLDAKVAIAEKVGQALLTSRNPQELSSKLAEHGITVGVSVDKENNNAIRGISFKSEEIKVGGKEIGYSWQTINDTFHVNKAKSLESAIVAQPVSKNKFKASLGAKATDFAPTLPKNLTFGEMRDMIWEEQKAKELVSIPIVSPSVKQPLKDEQKAKETTLNPNTAIAQAQTAREEIAEKLQTNLDQVAPGATPSKTPAVEPTANDFIAKKKWEDKYLYRGNNPDPKGTINNVAINETFKLALEMKSSMPKLANYSDEQIADQAIRLSMGNYKMGTFHNDKFITLSNPWDKWEKIRGKDHYEQLVKIVAEQKRGEIIILAENTKIESINQKIDIEEEQEQRRKSNRLGM